MIMLIHLSFKTFDVFVRTVRNDNFLILHEHQKEFELIKDSLYT